MVIGVVPKANVKGSCVLNGVVRGFRFCPSGLLARFIQTSGDEYVGVDVGESAWVHGV